MQIEMLGDDVVHADLAPGGGDGGHAGAAASIWFGDDGSNIPPLSFSTPRTLMYVRPRAHDVCAHKELRKLARSTM